jgi:hypothetical protein
MDMLVELANFRQDDRDELVLASLACPLCLCSAEVEWEFRTGGYDPSVECLCPHCEESWRVFMTPQQSLRLGLMGIKAS